MRKRIGYVTVDSGIIMVIDPTYADLWNEERHYSRVCKVLKHKEYGRLTIEGGATAVVAHAGDDGRYPVYAVMNSRGKIEKLEIVFEPIF